MVPGTTVAEANEKALHAAMEFRATLVRQGLIEEQRPAEANAAKNNGCTQQRKCRTDEAQRGSKQQVFCPGSLTQEQECLKTPARGNKASVMRADQLLREAMDLLDDGGVSDEPPSTTIEDGESTASSNASDSEIEAIIDELFTPTVAQPSMMPPMQPQMQLKMQPQKAPQSPLPCRSAMSRTPTQTQHASDQKPTDCCTTKQIAAGTRDSTPLPTPKARTHSDAFATDEAAPSTPPRRVVRVEPSTTPLKRSRPFECVSAPTAKIPGSVGNISARMRFLFERAGGPISVSVLTKELAQHFSAAEVDSCLRMMDDANKVMIMDGKVFEV
jgi:hypothetical protein